MHKYLIFSGNEPKETLSIKNHTESESLKRTYSFHRWITCW